jgi:ATP-binding cassette subfamily C (CFTR/MRP) protein 1
MSPGCWSRNDASFGPQVLECRAEFDFTVYFEESFLVIAPSSFAILSFLVRAHHLRSQPACAQSGKLLPLKLVCHAPIEPLALTHLLTTCLLQAAWTVLCCLKVALLALWALPSSPRTPASVPAAALSLVSVLLATALSPLEHRYSLKSSTVLSVYVLFTGLLDIAVTRTLWLALSSSTIPALVSASLALKLFILCLESLQKDALLFSEWKNRAVEETANVFSRSLFWWLNPVLWRGNRHNLSIDDLPGVDSALSHAEHFPGRWSNGTLAFIRNGCLF